MKFTDKLSLELIFGYLFSPIALIGIPFQDILLTGQLLERKQLLMNSLHMNL